MLITILANLTFFKNLFGDKKDFWVKTFFWVHKFFGVLNFFMVQNFFGGPTFFGVTIFLRSKECFNAPNTALTNTRYQYWSIPDLGQPPYFFGDFFSAIGSLKSESEVSLAALVNCTACYLNSY